MKQRSTTPVSTSLTAKAVLVSAAILMAIAAPLQLGSVVKADRYDDQIAAIQKEVDQYQAAAKDLAGKADTLQRELDRLTNEKNQLQSQIDLSQAKYDKLVTDIAANEKKIADNRTALGETMADLYVDGEVSPLEMLASSKNIGDYVDKQSYRETIRDKLTKTIEEIKRLKKQLESDKKEVERVLEDQKNQREALAAKENEQAQLVSQTRGEEAAYQNLSSQRNKDIASLRSQQAAENAAAMRNIGFGSIPAGVPGGGGYPGAWANAPLDAYVDPWGLYTRECVSYAAWKVSSTGRFVPHFGGRGNANQWPSTVAAYGISSGSTPKAGSVAMWPIGYYGHVMYVESVNGDGTITVSDYNLNWDGNYRHYTRSASGLTYIYF
jgi:peptidoglycan DL-endopeptidase CwlO